MSGGFTQKIYWASPYTVKKIFAWCNAWREDKSRHSTVFDCLIREIEQRDGWSREQFIAYQNEKLAEVLRTAFQNVPYYRDVFQARQIEPGEIRSVDQLAQIPLLHKDTLRSRTKEFIDRTFDKKSLVQTNTGGTTGSPLTIYREPYAEAACFAYNEVRCHRMAGMQRRVNRSVSLGSAPVAASNRTKPPFWVENTRWKQLYMSCYHLFPEHLSSYVEKIREFDPEYIEGYPSAIESLANFILNSGMEPVRLKAVFTTAEVLYEEYREVIERAFGCKVYNQYGSTENVIFAAECSCGSMHVSPEIGIVEVCDKHGIPLPTGQRGFLIGTNLTNKAMPLIRYFTGDMGALSTETCQCGSSLQVLTQLHGREDDCLKLKDGRRISQMISFRIFQQADGIAQGQFIQDSYEDFRILIVPAPSYRQEHGRKVEKALQDILGDVSITLETVAHIPRAASGKFRAVICNLGKDE